MEENNNLSKGPLTEEERLAKEPTKTSEVEARGEETIRKFADPDIQQVKRGTRTVSV